MSNKSQMAALAIAMAGISPDASSFRVGPRKQREESSSYSYPAIGPDSNTKAIKKPRRSKKAGKKARAKLYTRR